MATEVSPLPSDMRSRQAVMRTYMRALADFVEVHLPDRDPSSPPVIGLEVLTGDGAPARFDVHIKSEGSPEDAVAALRTMSACLKSA